jgi:cGMP-dependent protein kinase
MFILPNSPQYKSSGSLSYSGLMATEPNEIVRKKVKNRKPQIDTRKLQHEDFEPLSGNQIKTRQKTEADIRVIRLALKKNSLFKNLPVDQINTLVDEMKFIFAKENEVIIKQNTPGDKFFILVEGKLKVFINDLPKGFISPGYGFGEVALLHDTPRTASIIAIQDSSIWYIDRTSFKKAMKAINMSRYDQIRAFIESIPLFSVLTTTQKWLLVSSFVPLNYEEGQKIINEQEPGDLFYLIQEGTVSASVNGVVKRNMTRGEYFGEQALLYNSVRTATITANSPVVCLSIGRNELVKVLGDKLDRIIYKNSIKIALEKSSTYRKLTMKQQDSLISRCTYESFEQGSAVIDKGEQLDGKIWIILKGILSFQDRSRDFCIFTLICSEVISEIGTIVCPSNIVALEDSVVGWISKENLESAIGGDIHSVYSQNKVFGVLKKIPLLNSLPDNEISKIVQSLRVKHFQPKEFIVTQGSEGIEFFIIKSGSVEIFKDNVYLRTIHKSDYFGERSLMLRDIRSASVVAASEVSCWVLHKDDFMNTIHSGCRNLLMKRLMLQDDGIAMQDLIHVKLLGSGQFGNVHLVIHNSKNYLYALKSISRVKIEKYECYNDIVLERKILLQLDHPFIVKLVKTFKDGKRVHFLLEYVQGMDLFDTIRKMDILKENEARFYTSCLVLILEHLQGKNIIYRDLKPENIMVDSEGYPKLIDFGTAKMASRTFTMIGTPHYMAPELILNAGYNNAVDLWSLGIIVYEFICGRVPFGEDLDDPHDIYNYILNAKKVYYPKFVNTRSNIIALIEQLLSKNPAVRSGGSMESLKKHPFFNGLDWVISM